MQQAFGIFGGCAVVVQKSHAVRQNQIERAAVGRILHLRQNRHNGVVSIFQQGRRQCKIVAVQHLGTQMAILLQIGIPRAKPDFGFTGRYRQTVAAKVGACGGVRHICVEDFTVKGVRLVFFSGLLCGFLCGLLDHRLRIFRRGFFLGALFVLHLGRYRCFFSVRTGVRAAGIGLPAVGFGFIGLLFLGNDHTFLRQGRFGKRADRKHGAAHHGCHSQRQNALAPFGFSIHG